MHLTRAEITRGTPIPRKGTKYIARARSPSPSSVTVLVAIRDILHLARTTREVKAMIHDKKLKINNRVVRDYHESISFLSFFHADKTYQLLLRPTGRVHLEPVKATTRTAKIVGKRLVRGKAVQVSLHDGTNLLVTQNFSMGDSVHLDEQGRIAKIIPLKEGSRVFIMSGRNLGREGTVTKKKGNVLDVKVDDRTIALRSQQVVAL